MTAGIGHSASKLEIRNAAVSLAKRTVLHDITITLGAGETVAIIGPNGSGKTTLLRTLAGLLKPAEGTVLLDSESVFDLSRRAVSRQIAYMPQRSETHFPLTCREAVLLGRTPHKSGLGLADKIDLELSESAMRRLEVWDLAERPVTAVSGGELQRLMFARVIVQETKFVLLDEPTSAQDPRGQSIVCNMMQELAERGVGILAAVHDINLSLREFSKVVVLRDGRVLEQGSPGEILGADALHRAFEVKFRRLEDGGESFVWVAPDA